MAATWMILITGLIGGLICELFTKKADYRPGALTTVVYFCLNLGFVRNTLPLRTPRNQYFDTVLMQKAHQESFAMAFRSSLGVHP